MSSTTLQAQIPATLPDVWVSDVTTTKNNIPITSPDDVVVNCDMLTDVNSNLPIKAITWDEGLLSRTTHLYFEDGLGHIASFPNPVEATIKGFRPDIVLGNDINNPTQNYKAAVVFIDDQDFIRINIYLLKNTGTSSFSAYLVYNNTLTSIKQINLLHPSYSDTDPMPHIDMWSETTASIQGSSGKVYHPLYEWIATWSEIDGSSGAKNVFYRTGHINGSLSPTPTQLTKTSAMHQDNSDMPDVACGANFVTGEKYASFVYRTFNAAQALQVADVNMTTSSITLDSFAVNTALFPRIEAMNLFDPSMEARWDVVTIATLPTIPPFSTQQVYNMNYATGNAVTPLATIPLLQNLDIKSPCVAGGHLYVSGAPEIGNKQFTTGYFPWATQDLYVREIDAATGNPANANHYIANMNPLGPTTFPNQDYFLADVSKSFALSTCSNTGDYLLSAWYDGQDDGTGAGGHIWMKLSPNATTMQFKTTTVATVKGQSVALYPNPATTAVHLKQASTYRLYNITGTLLKTGTVAADEPISVQQLLPGAYYLQTNNGASYSFIKN